VIGPALAGAIILAVVLWETFETIVLPRRVTRRFRMTVVFYRATWRPWRAIGRRLAPKTREAFLSYYGPLSLFFLFLVWALGLMIGFAFLYYSASPLEGNIHFSTCFYLSGTTLFTLGIGDVVPHAPIERFFVVAESGLGLGFLALVLSYLPVIYQAFSRREVNIVLLDARAGSPPTAGELLKRHSGKNGMEALRDLLAGWERWAAEILESHVSYPVVSYFRSQHSNESWVAALAAILDVCALLISNAENACARQARLTFAICRHTVVDLAQVFAAAPRARSEDRLPSADFALMRGLLAEAGMQTAEAGSGKARLNDLRAMYEPYLDALAAHLSVDLPPWILSREITDNWRTSAWGRITGFSAQPAREAPLDDHSN